MEEENSPSSDPNVPRREPSDSGDFSSMQPPPPAEETRPLPPFAPSTQTVAAPPTSATAPARRSGAITAGVLAGALVIGGAAGVGGSAWYDAWKGDGSNSSQVSSSSAPVSASSAADKPNGSVQSVAASVLPSVVKINVSSSSEAGSGSGIILSKDGEILTNNHVVQVAGKNGTITVNFNDGKTVRATVVGTDPVTDIAVIKADGVSNLKPATIGKSSALAVGQAVVAVGSPYGLNATVTSGIVSALNRPVSVSSEQAPQQQSPVPGFPGFGDGPSQGQSQSQAAPDTSTTYPAIQTDAAINPGNSGGPLVNMSGEVVGINSSIRTSDSADSSSEQGGSIGLGFSIPIDEVLPIVNQLIDHQTPTHARLGATVSDVTGNTLVQGAVVKALQSGAAGAQAGLKKADVITKVDDEVIDGSESLVATIRGHRPGDTVTLTYLRDGQTKTVDVKLGSDANTKTS